MRDGWRWMAHSTHVLVDVVPLMFVVTRNIGTKVRSRPKTRW